MERKLWYDREANVWDEALPIGNGRIGGMVFSNPIYDKIQLNEDTLWSGYPDFYSEQHSMDEVKEIRELVKDEKYVEATQKTSESMKGYHSQCYISYGNLYMDIAGSKGKVSDYKRELNLENGVVKTSYCLDDTNIEKEYFVSLQDDVLVLHMKSDKKLKLHIHQSVEPAHSVYVQGNEVVFQGKCPTDASQYTLSVEYDDSKESVQFCSRTRAMSEGNIFCGGNSLWIYDFTEATILFSIKTSFNGYDKFPISQGKEYIEASREVLSRIEGLSYEELKERHAKKYAELFDRVSLEIDGEDYSHLPTDVRIENAGKGVVDNGLVTLLWDFARYLTIAASMEGTQPTNLQGIWCYHTIAPWHCNYTMNINTQMNYWPTETINLPECHMPLLKMLKEFSQAGNHFGLRGWSSWHNSDLWRFNYEATKGVLWGYWQMGGFWSVRHIWEHYLHTRDVEFLKEYYPVMEGAAAFLEDWMYENEEGYLVTCPSTSPENQFLYQGEQCAVCQGSAMDMGIIYDLFDKTIKSGQLLGKDTAHYESILAKLAPIKIGADGRILEWGKEFDENEPGHRHISHLYFLFPSDIYQTQEYKDAAEKSMRYRLANGGGHTGWSNAWIANVWARLGDGEMAMGCIRTMFKKSIYPNMFDAHPPFQIDGNYGICSAICEMLLQSHTGETELLPAIPAEWKSGRVRGLRSRTGESVSFAWKDGKVIEQQIG